MLLKFDKEALRKCPVCGEIGGGTVEAILCHLVKKHRKPGVSRRDAREGAKKVLAILYDLSDEQPVELVRYTLKIALKYGWLKPVATPHSTGSA